jgi:hypothetical protein
MDTRAYTIAASAERGKKQFLINGDKNKKEFRVGISNPNKHDFIKNVYVIIIVASGRDPHYHPRFLVIPSPR